MILVKRRLDNQFVDPQTMINILEDFLPQEGRRHTGCYISKLKLLSLAKMAEVHSYKSDKHGQRKV